MPNTNTNMTGTMIRMMLKVIPKPGYPPKPIINELLSLRKPGTSRRRPQADFMSG